MRINFIKLLFALSKVVLESSQTVIFLPKVVPWSLTFFQSLNNDYQAALVPACIILILTVNCATN